MPTKTLFRHLRLKPPVKHASPEATSIVMSILRKHDPVGLRTKQIFDEAITLYPPGPPPLPRNAPRAHRSISGTIIQPVNEPINHPLQSIRFLKTVVLKELEDQQLVEEKLGPLDRDALTSTEHKRFFGKGGGVGDPKGFRWTLVKPGDKERRKPWDREREPPKTG